MNSNILLFFPPGWCPYQPYLSTPKLSGHLKSIGFHAKQFDLNVEYYEYILSGDNIKRILEELNSAVINAVDSSKVEVFTEIEDELSEYIIEAKNTFRSSLYSDFQRYERALKIILLTLELYSTRYQNFIFELEGIKYNSKWSSIEQILNIIFSDRDNPFFSFYREFLFEHSEIENFELFGISVVNHDQLISGLTLGYLLKTQFPDSKVIIGGDVSTRLKNQLFKLPQLSECFDWLIFADGEEPLACLLSEIDSGSLNYNNVPNLMRWLNNSPWESDLKSRTPGPYNAIIPDFSDLNFSKYLSPYPILPIELGKGCYWNKCTFCEETYKPYKSNVHEDLKLLIDDHTSKYNTQTFTIVDPCPSPKNLQSFANIINEQKIDIKWRTLLRMEKVFDRKFCEKLYDSGCRLIMTGIETASERVSSLMKKGITSENNAKVLKNFHDAGIWTHSYFMFGYPSETILDAEETISYIKDISMELDSLSYSFFVAPIHTPVIKQQNELNYFIKKNSGGDIDLSLHYTDLGGDVLNRDERKFIVRKMDQVKNYINTDSEKWMSYHIDQIFSLICDKGKQYFGKSSNIE